MPKRKPIAKGKEQESSRPLPDRRALEGTMRGLLEQVEGGRHGATPLDRAQRHVPGL